MIWGQKMRLFPSAPNGVFPESWNFNFLSDAMQSNNYKAPGMPGVDEVT
jgi:hypothetical protein